MEPIEKKESKRLSAEEIERLGRIAENLRKKYEAGEWDESKQDKLRKAREALANDGQPEILLVGIDELLRNGTIRLAYKHVEAGKTEQAEEYIRKIETLLAGHFRKVLSIARLQAMDAYPLTSAAERKDVSELWHLTYVVADLHLKLRMRNPAAAGYPQALRRLPPILVSDLTSPAGPVGEEEPMSSSEVNAVLLSALMLDAWRGQGSGLATKYNREEVFQIVKERGSEDEKEYMNSIADMRALVTEYQETRMKPFGHPRNL